MPREKRSIRYLFAGPKMDSGLDYTAYNNLSNMATCLLHLTYKERSKKLENRVT